MENASKALIIAGAILLSILIISLGIMIFNGASGVVKNNSMDETEIQQFNAKFLNYEGNRVKGSTVNSMLQQVVTSNLGQDDEYRKIPVKFDYTPATGTTKAANVEKTTSSAPKVPTGSTFKVSCVISDGNNNGEGNGVKANTGLVCQIVVGDPE